MADGVRSWTISERCILGALWAALMAEAIWLSPPARPDQWAWLVDLVTGNWGREEPLTVALFNLMGVWPMAMTALLAPRLRRAPLPLWPFAIASFALGAFALIPGLLIGTGSVEPRRWQGWIGSRPVVGVCMLLAAVLSAFGAGWGSPTAFLEQWRTEQFVHVMALDFVVLSVVSILCARREGGPWVCTLIPLFGALLYRGLRPLSAPTATEDPGASSIP